MKYIILDLDGTVVDLYGVDNWLEKLRKEDVTPYVEATPIGNADDIAHILSALQGCGWNVVILTALAGGDVSAAYLDEIKTAKTEWLTVHGIPYNALWFVPYGGDKWEAFKQRTHGFTEEAILFDDSVVNRKQWGMTAIAPAADGIARQLAALLN